MLNKKSMLNRILVGAAILVVWVGMVLLNIFLTNSITDESISLITGRAINSLIIYALIIVAVYEMRRALGLERIPRSFNWLLWLYGVCVGPIFTLFGFLGVTVFALVVFVCALVTAAIVNRVDSLVHFAFILIYPGLLFTGLLYINQAPALNIDVTNSVVNQYLQNDIWAWMGQYLNTSRANYLTPMSGIGLALVFTVSTLTDTCAYFVGSLFGKHKLCPKVSPKKTIEGAVGGIVGGVIGALLVYLLFDLFGVFGPQFGLTFEGLGLSTAQIVVVYVVIGVIGPIVTQVGDLLASMVKRYCGIKDYSRILGEHGGIMDRFDGIMLNAALVAIVFMFIL